MQASCQTALPTEFCSLHFNGCHKGRTRAVVPDWCSDLTKRPAARPSKNREGTKWCEWVLSCFICIHATFRRLIDLAKNTRSPSFPRGGAEGPLGKPNDERHSQQSSEEQGPFSRSTVYQKGYQKGLHWRPSWLAWFLN